MCDPAGIGGHVWEIGLKAEHSAVTAGRRRYVVVRTHRLEGRQCGLDRGGKVV